MEFEESIIEATKHTVICSREQAIIILDEVERQKGIILGDLSRYAEHLKQNYQIGSQSPFHLLVVRINNQLSKEDTIEKKGCRKMYKLKENCNIECGSKRASKIYLCDNCKKLNLEGSNSSQP